MNKKWWLIAFIFCLAVAALSPLASSSPDGLERVAEGKGFLGLAGSSPFSVIADYAFPGIHNEALATILAGWLGTVIVFGLAYGVTWLITRARQSKLMPTNQ
ncbi:MAG: hypothetical protein C4542_01085 [Dehalococcoidia bacterium]|nr:MAG: hypothetical protein C4542_01085 [Dehalococcoidia bacterium]